MSSVNENYLFALVSFQMGFIDATVFLDALESGQLEANGGFADQLSSTGSVDVQAILDRVEEIQVSRTNNRSADSTLTLDSSDTVQLKSKTTSADNVNDERYRAIRLHASGGLGQVWVARDLDLDRNVALKRILPHRANSRDARRAFENEAQITGKLEHPSIVPVYGFGRHEDGSPYYAMRFVTDQTLQQAISEYHAISEDPSARALRLIQLLKSFTDVCNAVQCAHANGILHRDIKPSNIVLGEFGEAYLIDWGLAAHDSDLAGSSSSRQLVGTPMYMSPEQAAAHPATQASDVYGLGATLYELLAGAPPFAPLRDGHPPCDFAQLLAKVQAGDFVNPRDRQVDVDKLLQQICLKAMALKPEDRFNSPREIVLAIERFQTDLPLRHWRRAVSHFEDQLKHMPHEPEFQLSLARSRHNLGVACWGQQRFDESIEHLDAAMKLFTQLDATAEYNLSRELAGVSLSLARVNAQTRQKESALLHYERAQQQLTSYLSSRNREVEPDLLLQMFEPSDVGFLRYLFG